MTIPWRAPDRARGSPGRGGPPVAHPTLRGSSVALSGYLYSQKEDALAVHHYVTSEARTNGITLRVRSGLPYQGNNTVDVQAEAPVEKALSFRVPNWAGQSDPRG